jgi:hypothetical protein
MQTLTLNITRNMVASEIRPGTAIVTLGFATPVVVEEVRANLDDLRFMVRRPGHPRRKSITVDHEDMITVLPLASEVERLVNALAVAHRGDVGDDWNFAVVADPLDPELPSDVIDVYDIGQDIGVLESPLPADLLPRRTKVTAPDVNGETDD